MQRYIGTKIVNAMPATQGEYNDLRKGISPPKDPDEPGYLVEYEDGGEPNSIEFKGYISWSPKHVFERAYRPVERMTFGQALEALRIGSRVKRKVWDGTDVHVWLESGKALCINDRLCMQANDGARILWTASRADLLADDWYVLGSGDGSDEQV